MMQSTKPAQIDFGRGFSYILEDPEWVSKTLIGALIALISILILPGFLLLGYYVEVIQNVAAGNPRPLPAWNNLSEKFVSGLTYGLKYLVAFLVYALPAIVLYIVGLVLVTAGASENHPAPGTPLAIPFFLVSGLYGIVIAFISPLLTIHLIRDPFATIFDFRRVVAEVQVNFVNLIIVLVGMLLAGFVAQLGFIACFVGLFWTAFLGRLIEANYIGQLWRSMEGQSNTPNLVQYPVNPYIGQPR